MTTPAGRFVSLGAPSDTVVEVCEVGTTTAASLYTDTSSGDAAPNPITTDGYGMLTFFAAAGHYDLVFVSDDTRRRVTVTVQPDPAQPWPG